MLYRCVYFKTNDYLASFAVQNQLIISPQDAYASIDEIASELPEKAFTDLSTLLEQGNWMDYEGSYSVDASIVSEPSQTREFSQIKNCNSETLPPHTAPIVRIIIACNPESIDHEIGFLLMQTDSSLTRTSMLTNYILRVAAALRMYAGSGDATHILNRFLHLMVFAVLFSFVFSQSDYYRCFTSGNGGRQWRQVSLQM